MASGSRLGKCEVCDDNTAKYTCPECEVKTCCLQCVNIHKKELECTGIRNRVKYKSLRDFNNLDLQSDYMLLEETARVLDRVTKGGKRRKYNKNLPVSLNKLRIAAKRRRVNLEFLPANFERRKENTTYLDWGTDSLYWRIKWVFPYAEQLELSDNRVLDTLTLGEAVSKYVDPDQCDDSLKERLRFYHSKFYPNLTVLLKAEKMGADKFYVIHFYETIREALARKVIIEYPIFYIVYTDHKEEYEIVFTDDDDSECEAEPGSKYFFNGNDKNSDDKQRDNDNKDNDESDCS